MKTPVVLVAGFLGSGKTTFVRHLLAHSGRNVAVIVNEFGDLSIDTQTVQGDNIAVREILEGCVCCSLQGELDAALEEVVLKYSPDVVVVETTGIAEPGNVITSVSSSSALVSLSCVVTVVDCDVQIRFPGFSGSLAEQVRSADIVLLNKKDLVSVDQVGLLETQVKAINSRAVILPTVRCAFDVELIFGDQNLGRIRDGMTASPISSQIHDDLDPVQSDHSHPKKDMLAPSEHVHNLSFVTGKLVSMSLAECEREFVHVSKKVWRAKGFLHTPTGDVYRVEMVASRFFSELVASTARDVVLIGPSLSREEVRQFLL